MKKKYFRSISISLLVVLILVLVTVTAGVIVKFNLAKQYPAPGQLVDVDGHKMHINCMGQGSPTIILEAGVADFSLTWAYVQPEVARIARVCSYDRAGYGWSEPGPNRRTAKAEIAELHTLLGNAHVQGPFVLVGHSLGGMLIRGYAHNFPDEVAGIVLVDSFHENQPIRLPEIEQKTLRIQTRTFRMLGLLSSTGIPALMPQLIPNLGLPNDAYAQWQAVLSRAMYYQTTIAELNALEESSAELRAMNITSFGNIPLIVLSRGQWESTSLLSDIENQALWTTWQDMQTELVLLSSSNTQIIAEQSGHHIQLDEPGLVIEAIREMSDMLQ